MAILPTGLEGMSLMREVTPNKLTAILEDVSRCCCLLFCLNSIFQIKAYDDLKKLVGSDGRKRFFQLAMFSALCKWTPVNHQTSNTNLQCVCVCFCLVRTHGQKHRTDKAKLLIRRWPSTNSSFTPQ